MALTKSAGRVSIRVLPDSKGFRDDLQKFLNRIEKTTRIKIEAVPVLDKAALVKMKRDIQNLAITIKPKIELNITAEEIAELVAKIERAKPVVEVSLNTRAAAARMANLSRTRTAVIVPVLARAAVAKVVTRLAALGGANVLADTFRDASEFLNNIDRNAVRLGNIATAVMAIAGAAGALAANTLTLSADIGKLVGFSTLLPAFGIGLAIQVGSLAAIMKDLSTELAHLGPLMDELQDILSFTFWREARPAITELVTSMMPALINTLDQLGTAQGIFAARVAQSIQRHLTNDRFETMMFRLVDGIREATNAIDPFVHAITLLGLHGSKYFERFGKWITTLSEQFDDFITRSFENGDLERWTENAIRTVKDLARVVGNTYRIFDALTDAARRAGAASMGDLADGLGAVADQMERPAFQTTMTRIFRGMISMVDQLKDGIRDLGRGFEAMGPEIETAFKITGTILRDLLGYIADFMENPAFQQGFEEFFGGISRGIKNLAPAIEPAATSLGGLLDLLGLVAEELGNLLATVMVEWGPEFDKIGEELEKLVVPLSTTLQSIVDKLTPVFETLAEDTLPPIVDLIENELLPGLEELADWAAPQLQDFFEELGAFIENELTPEVALFREEMKKSGTDGESAFANILKGAQEVVDFITDEKDTWGSWFNEGEGEGWTIHFDNIKRDLTNFEDWLHNWRERLFGEDSPNSLGTQLNQWVMDAGDALPGLVEGFRGMGEDIDTEFQKFVDEFGRRWDQFWNETIPNAWDEYMEDMERDLSDWYGGIKGMFQDWMEDLMPDWDKFWADLFGEPTDQSDIARAGFGESQAGWTADLDAWLADLGPKWEEFWGTTFPTAWEDFKNGFTEGWNAFWSPEGLGGQITSFFTTIGDGWNNFWGVTLPTAWNNFVVWLGESWNMFWTGLGLYLLTKWEEFKTTVATKFEEIKLGIATKIAEIQLAWNTFWAGVGTYLSTKWEEFKTTVGTKFAEIQTDINTKVEEIKANWNNGWAAIGAALSMKWEEFKSTISTKAAEIGMTIIRWIENAKRDISNGWEAAKIMVRNKWNEIVTTVQTKIDEAINWVRTLPDRAREALNIDLSGSGAALIQGFIDGMGSMVTAAKIKAAEIMMAVRENFPFSPAKVGPFSGRGYTTYSGAALVKDFAKGMESRVALARAAAEKVAEAAQIDTSALDDNFSSALEGGGPGDHRTNIFNTYYPVAEKQSRTIEKTSGLIRMKGGL